MKVPLKIQGNLKTDREISIMNLSSEKTSLGKRSYAEYLGESKVRQQDANKGLRLQKAKDTIEEVHKYRKENNIDLSFC